METLNSKSVKSEWISVNRIKDIQKQDEWISANWIEDQQKQGVNQSEFRLSQEENEAGAKMVCVLRVKKLSQVPCEVRIEFYKCIFMQGIG